MMRDSSTDIKEKAENNSLGQTTKGFDKMSITQNGMQNQSKSMLEWALMYAENGWAVFPLKKDKKPLTENGFKDATTDAEQIKAWWTKWPNAGIGLPTGNIFSVLDFDLNLSGNKEGPSHPEIWDKYKDMLSRHPRVRTQNGYHVYFVPTKAADGSLVRNRSGIGPETGEYFPNGKPKKACDWRGDGGYVVAPPSAFVDGTGRYHWEVKMSSSPLSEAPVFVRDWLFQKKSTDTTVQKSITDTPSDVQKTAYLKSTIDGICNDMRGVGEGVRNDTLFPLACRMYEYLNGSLGTLPEASKFEDELKDAARATGLEDDEIETTLNSAKEKVGSKAIEPEFKQQQPVDTKRQETKASSNTQPSDEQLRWDKLKGASEMRAVLNKIGFSGYYDALSNRTVYLINGHEVEAYDNGQLVANIVTRISNAGYIIGTGSQTLSALQNLMDGICHETRRNPVSEYLEALPIMSSKDEAFATWIELAKVGGYSEPTMSGTVLGEFVAAEYNRWMHPEKARGQHWAVLIRGGQRGGKSGLFRWLTDGISKDNNLFTEVSDASDNKALVESAMGTMFTELSEGCLMNKRDEASMKALLSMTEFSGRFAYARKAKRVTVSWGYVITTNDSFILRDPTGASRYACLEFTPEVNRLSPIERSTKIASRVMAFIESNRNKLWSAAKTIAQGQGASLEAISDGHAGMSEWLEAGRESNRCVTRDEDFLLDFLENAKRKPDRYFSVREAEDFVLKMRDETKDVRRADIRKTITSIMQRYTDWVFKTTYRKDGVRIAQRVYVYEGAPIPSQYEVDENEIPW